MAPSDERHLDGAPEIDVDAGGDFRAGETGDATQASEEGLAWVPPMDPPVIPGDRGDPEIAAGFGTTAEDDPFDADHAGELLSPHGQVEELVLEALRADAATSPLADRVTVDVDGGTVVVAGEVDDLDDEDAILRVAQEVDGVGRAVSRLRLRGSAEE